MYCAIAFEWIASTHQSIPTYLDEPLSEVVTSATAEPQARGHSTILLQMNALYLKKKLMVVFIILFLLC